MGEASEQPTTMKKGVPVSPGVAVARAYCVDEVLARREPHQLDAAALSDEISRFDSACAAAAPELLPSQALTFDRMQVAGIATESGGSTGHAAILARSLGIPAVSGLRGILREIHTGDVVALDGREG